MNARAGTSDILKVEQSFEKRFQDIEEQIADKASK